VIVTFSFSNLEMGSQPRTGTLTRTRAYPASGRAAAIDNALARLDALEVEISSLATSSATALTREIGDRSVRRVFLQPVSVSIGTKEPLNKDGSVIEKRRFPISSRLWVLISLPCGPLPQFGGGVRRHYAAADSSFLRTRNRFTRAKAANNRLAFFAKPR
jgi:hypothetical protein